MYSTTGTFGTSRLSSVNGNSRGGGGGGDFWGLHDANEEFLTEAIWEMPDVDLCRIYLSRHSNLDLHLLHTNVFPMKTLFLPLKKKQVHVSKVLNKKYSFRL